MLNIVKVKFKDSTLCIQIMSDSLAPRGRSDFESSTNEIIPRAGDTHFLYLVLLSPRADPHDRTDNFGSACSAYGGLT